MATSATDAIETLNKLIQLDADAIHLYEKAIEHVDELDVVVRDDLEAFQSDHERHVEDLTKVVRDLGGDPIAAERDLKGAVLEIVTAMRSLTGTRGALKAMRMNEHHTNKVYREAAGVPLPEIAAAVVMRNLEDEQRHLAAIEAHLERLDAIEEMEETVVEDELAEERRPNTP